MQRLLNAAEWESVVVRDDLRAYVSEQLGDADGMLVVDDSGFPKMGTKSAGMQRQHSGTVGRIENCRSAVPGVRDTQGTRLPGSEFLPARCVGA